MARDRHLSFGVRRAQAQFDLLLRPHLDHLYRLAYRFTGSADRAEDLVQDLLLRVYPRCEELAQLDQPRPWLARVMYRMFVDQIRRESRAPHLLIADRGRTDDTETEDPLDTIPDTAPGPEDELVLQYDRERLAQAWELLNPDHRALLALFEIEGYTLQELEVILEVTRGTLKSRLHRARTQLALLLTSREPFATSGRVKDMRGTKS